MDDVGGSKLSTTEILNRTTDLNIYKHFYEQVGTKFRADKYMLSPFQKEKTPSFHIFKARASSANLFMCFASGLSGDCFLFVGELYGETNLFKICQIINSEMNLGIGSSSHIPFKMLSVEELVAPRELTEAKVRAMKCLWNQNHFDWMHKYGITENDMSSFNWQPIKYFVISGKDFYAKDGFPIFGIQVNDRHKFYMPGRKPKYIGNTNSSDVYGLTSISPTGDDLIIAAGHKDTLFLLIMGFNAVCFNGETVSPDDIVMYDLKDRFLNVHVLYDNDLAGKGASQRIVSAYNLNQIFMSKEYNDVGVYLEKHGIIETQKEIRKLIS